MNVLRMIAGSVVTVLVMGGIGCLVAFCLFIG